eukprot:31487-Pelagococcus_subviridis.AAC.6
MSRVAAQKTWQQIWIRPEVRPRANPTRSDPARVRARRRGRARRGNGTLARSATPPDESPPPPPPRPSLTSPLPSIAGVSHRRGDRQRGHALRVLLRPSDLQLSRLPVRPAPPTSESFTRDRGIDFHPPRARPSPRRGALPDRAAPRSRAPPPPSTTTTTRAAFARTSKPAPRARDPAIDVALTDRSVHLLAPPPLSRTPSELSKTRGRTSAFPRTRSA